MPASGSEVGQRVRFEPREIESLGKPVLNPAGLVHDRLGRLRLCERHGKLGGEAQGLCRRAQRAGLHLVPDVDGGRIDPTQLVRDEADDRVVLPVLQNLGVQVLVAGEIAADIRQQLRERVEPLVDRLPVVAARRVVQYQAEVP